MSRSLEEIIFTLQERDERAVERLPSRRTDLCPALPHFREALLEPSRWTDEERRHVFEERCAPCQKTLAQLRQNLWHPDRLDLFRVAFNLPVREARYVALHLERDACARCNALVRFMRKATVLRPLVELVRGGAGDALDRVRVVLSKMLAPRDTVLLPVAATAQGFDTAPHAELFEQFVLGHELTVTLQEDRGTRAGRTESSLLLLTVETREPRYEGRTLRYVLMGPTTGEEVAGEIALGQAGHEGWISGTIVVGPLLDLQQRVGDDLVIMVYDPTP